MAELDGTRVGNYHFLRRIGSGGMGDVYLAEQTSLGRQVVIKVMRPDVSIHTDAEEKDRHIRQFMQEARAIASLDHPHILPLYDYGEEGPIRYLVMAYVPDGSLADMLSPGPSQRLRLPLPPPFVAEIIVQAGEALQFAHDRGIIHRDVKPGNLLLQLLSPVQTGQPDPALPRIHLFLADFGLARFLSEVAEGTTSLGTPLYNAPEQYQGHPAPATDQYALACVAYLLLCGQPVFSGTVAELYHQHLSVEPRPATRVNALLPPAVDTPLHRALAKVPEERFPRIMDFALALEATIRPAALASRPLPLRASVASPVRPRSPDPLSSYHADGSPAPLPEPRPSRPRPAEVVAPLPGTQPQQADPRGVAEAPTYADAPGAPLPSRSSTWRRRWQSLVDRRRRLILVSVAMLVLILLGSVGFTVVQRVRTAIATNNDVVRIARAGSIDIRNLPALHNGTESSQSSVPLRLNWTEAQAPAQARSADHVSALPALPPSASALAPLASSVPGKLPATSLSGLGQSEVGASAPLDTSIAANAQFVVEAADGAFQITGLDPNQSTHVAVGVTSLFEPVLQPGGTLGEPRVFFDNASRRWITVVNELHTQNAVVSAGFFDVAISDSDQPTASWSVYQFSTLANLTGDSSAAKDWADDPQIGNDSQAFYISGNLFAASIDAPFLGSVVYDLPKREFATSKASVDSSIYILTGFANQQKKPVLGVTPAQTDGAENTEWLISNDAGYVDSGQTSNRIIVWVITDPSAVNSGKLPSLVGVVLKMPLTYADPPMPIQKGSNVRLSSGDARFAQVYFTSGHLYGAFTAAVNWAGDSATRSGIYWVDLVPALGGTAGRSSVSVSVAEVGIYGFTGGYTFDPELIPTRSGDLALFMEASASGFYPSFVSVTRRSTDPADEMGSNGLVLLAPGLAPVAPSPGSNWSDYIGGSAVLASGNQPDVVWGAGPYQGNDPAYWHTLLWQVQPGGAN